MSKYISAYVDFFENLPFGFENQKKRLSLVGFMPQQANTNSAKDKDGVEQTWFQVVGIYDSSYSRSDENGEVHNDNASIKTLVVKVRGEHLRKSGISTSQFKDFLDKNYIGKKMIVLPCTEEKQSKKLIGDKYVVLPHQTEVSVLEDFDLRKFCNLEDKK
ncbi:MAG: hypothetical protein PHN38_04150 [Sulfurospirillaceae bacterium]|nr:hypothetical protein [Sulfurospirillaceae bacterium]